MNWRVPGAAVCVHIVEMRMTIEEARASAFESRSANSGATPCPHSVGIYSFLNLLIKNYVTISHGDCQLDLKVFEWILSF